MKKWVCLFSLCSAACFGRNAETAALLEKVEADAPVYAQLVAKLIDKYTKMSEVYDCDVQLEEDPLTGELEKVSVAVRVDPELLKNRRKLYEAKVETAIGIVPERLGAS